MIVYYQNIEIMLRGHRNIYSLYKIRKHLLQHSKHMRILSKFATNTWSFIQNIDNWRFWIRKKNALLNLKNHNYALKKLTCMLNIHMKQNINFSLTNVKVQTQSIVMVLKILFPSKHFLFSNTSCRHLEDVFSVTLFVFQDLLKTSSRRLQDVFKTSLRRVCKTSCNYVFKMFWKTKSVTQDVFKTPSVRLHQDECLLVYQMIWMIFMEILRYIIQIKNAK